MQSITNNIEFLKEEALKVWRKKESWSSYVSQENILVSVLDSIATQLNFINKYKIIRPLGENILKSNVKKLESWRSRRSLINIVINNLELIYNTVIVTMNISNNFK